VIFGAGTGNLTSLIQPLYFVVLKFMLMLSKGTRDGMVTQIQKKKNAAAKFDSISFEMFLKKD
jgi:hypothetical protein